MSEASDRLEKLASLWRREREASKARHVEERKNVPLGERVARGIAARDLTVDETDAAPGGRVLLWLVPKRANELELLRVGPGDPVRLWTDDPDGPTAISGVVSRRREAKLGVVVDEDAAVFDGDPSFHLDRDEPMATFDRGDRALAKFRDAKPGSDEGRMREVLLGDREARFAASPEILFPKDAALNEPQREAVARALAAQDVALIHGPPGTGKTRALVEVVRQAVARGERVLVAAASNTAVDNLAARLDGAGVPLVRLGHPARVSPEVERRSLDALLEESGAFDLARQWHAEAMELKRRANARLSRGAIHRGEHRSAMRDAGLLHRDARKHLQGAQEAILARMPVVCSTAAGADVAMLGDTKFDLVVLDEATQAVDPIALVALARGKRAVLAGDPRQLPPTVIDLEAAREGLGETIFERLEAAARGDVLRLLIVQHRMHESIMAFPSASMYAGKLVAAPGVARHRLEDLPGVEADPLRPLPWHFLDTSGKGWTEERTGDDPSTCNPGEAERVVAEARRLLSRGVAPASLAIITPYDAQVRLLRAAMRPEMALGLEIGSVDGFQGREKEAILVDLVRSNDESEIGFLGDTRRMNVALTRARRFLLVIGDGSTLAGHRYYDQFLDAAQKSGAWLSAWNDDAPPLHDENPGIG